MRGEKTLTDFPSTPESGSSPHARGKDEVDITPEFRVRIIPACAGKRDRAGGKGT